MGEDEPEVDRLRSRPAGADPEDPYEDVDLSELPAWWRRAVREFEAHDLRPYRPPRFEDGTPVHEAVEAIEDDLGVRVSFGATDGDYRERWEVRVDGKPAGKVGRRRSPEGYTVYEVESDAFRELVAAAIE